MKTKNLLIQALVGLSIVTFVACSDDTKSKTAANGGNTIKVSGGDACGTITGQGLVPYVNHVDGVAVINLNNDHPSNQYDQGAIDFIESQTNALSCHTFEGPLQPMQYELSLDISPIENGQDPIMVLDIIAPDLAKRYHFVSTNANETASDIQYNTVSNDTLDITYNFGNGVYAHIHATKGWFGDWQGTAGIGYTKAGDTFPTVVILGSFSVDDDDIRSN